MRLIILSPYLYCICVFLEFDLYPRFKKIKNLNLSNSINFSTLSSTHTHTQNKKKKKTFLLTFSDILCSILSILFFILFKYTYFILLSYLNIIFFIHSLSFKYSFVVERGRKSFFNVAFRTYREPKEKLLEQQNHALTFYL